MKGNTVGEAIQAMIDAGAEVKSVQLPAAPAPRLPDVEMSEKNFQQAVIDYAQERGWKVAHFRKVRVSRGKGAKQTTYWETPVAADGKGFPDLVMLRETKLVVFELKVGKNDATKEQLDWLSAFGGVASYWGVMYPRDWPTIVEVLT
jgi:hypothetical protein